MTILEDSYQDQLLNTAMDILRKDNMSVEELEIAAKVYIKINPDLMPYGWSKWKMKDGNSIEVFQNGNDLGHIKIINEGV
jgi:hypothetical protein